MPNHHPSKRVTSRGRFILIFSKARPTGWRWTLPYLDSNQDVQLNRHQDKELKYSN